MYFLPNIKAQILIEKFNYWKKESNLNFFYNNHLSNNIGSLLNTMLEMFPRCGTEILDDSDYIIFKDEILYHRNLVSGSMTVLRETWNHKDCICYKQLQLSIKPIIKIPGILYREIVNVDNKSYEYIEFENLNFKLDSNVFFNFITNHNSDYFVSLAKEYIDDGHLLLKESKNISKLTGHGIPLDLILGLSKFKNNNDNYWNVSLNWTYDPEYVADVSFYFFINLVNYIGKLNNLKTEDIDYIKTYTREKWII